MLIAALLGFALGFVGSMPLLGPVAILVFTHGVENRLRNGFYLAVGAALAESAYAYLAFWGFSQLLERYAWIEPTTRAVGAVILTGLGLRFALRGGQLPAGRATSGPEVGNKRSFFLGFAVTALNPALIATWTLALTTLYLFYSVGFDARRAFPFSVGVGVGIVTWFAILLSLLGRYRDRFRPLTLTRAIRVMGVALTIVGLVFAVRFALYLRTGS
jgi:threonine/homoserine/homoserine lactone efflux protein